MTNVPEKPTTDVEALAFFASLTRSGIRLGLGSVHRALEALDHPERAYTALHVAGTNGKGSTCAFAANCLLAQGYRVGLYTSPHLVRPNERFRIDGQEIDDALMAKRIREVLERYPEAATPPAPLTYFEFGTLVALWHFSQEKVAIAVLETGLGGRLDATNAVQPAVTAITSLSIDHVDYLGGTLTSIATEKAGIIKPGVPCVISTQLPEALAVVEAKARECGAPLSLEGRDFRLRAEGSRPSYEFIGSRWHFDALRLGLRGPHQVSNAAVAVSALELLDQRGFPVLEEPLRRGLETTRWPGRLEEFSTSPTVLLDGAHNLAGIESLIRGISQMYPGRRIHLVFGVLADKAWSEMVAALFPHCASVSLTPVASSRSLDPNLYLGVAKSLCDRVDAHPSPLDALSGAMSLAKGSDLVVCAGSLFLVGAIRARLLGK